MLIKSDKKLKEVKIFKTSIFKDNRGQIWTKWDKKSLKNKSINLSKLTTSKKNVLRGFHGDNKSWKLITCLSGEILTVIVDYRKSSKNYLKYTSINMSEKNKVSVLIPPNFLNSWLCISKNCLYQYKYSFKGSYNDVKDQISLKWNDPKINFKWPIKKIKLSKRDK